MRLSDLAKEYLYNKGYRGVSGYRFELNAILPDTRRIEYIERKLKENGVRGKVIPPNEKLSELADEMYRDKLAVWAYETIAQLLSVDEIEKALADEFRERFGLANARRYTEEGFGDDLSLSWRAALANKLQILLSEEHNDALNESLRRMVVEAVKDEGQS